MDPVKDAASSLDSKPAVSNMPSTTGAPMAPPPGPGVQQSGTPSSNIAPGTEGAQHSGQIEPHSPAANALPNSGASGVINPGAVAQSVTSTIHTDHPSVTETNIPMTAERISVDDNTVLPKNQNPNDVKFKVSYGSYKGEKTFPEGSVQIVSKESADHFTKIGIGKVIK